MNTALKKTIAHWGFLSPYTHVPRNDAEYEKLSGFLEELMDASRHAKKDDHVTSLLKLVAKNIEEYEAHRFPTESASPLQVLEFLMEEHGLLQSDLPEIGGQSLVSKILSGERQLTVEHIQKLSKRFGVSPSVFIEGSGGYRNRRSGNYIFLI
ncbi:MAG TPA: helix-turn-helix domain-containing protein [Gammaproteobacteria bacterium]|nr:helix-turn-helix domain-containing protein [Gammaproteobacteria bacterium]